MQLKIIKNCKFLASLCSIVLPHFPKFLWNAYFSPLPCFLKPKSLLQKQLKKSNSFLLPKDYCIDPSIALSDLNITHFSSYTNNKEININNVVILKNGSIISDETVCCESSLFQKISLDRLLMDSVAYYSLKKNIISEATFIPRQLIDHGTYGDYFAEFLIPFCCHQIKKENTLLIDADFIEKYAKLDLETIGYHNSIRIPASGVRVKKLTIKLPVQFFDNFMSQNLLKLKEVFPVEHPSDKNKKVYISRVGFEPDFANKNQRKIINEVEVEQYLRSAGFYILRSHEQNNKDCRSILKAAEIIVFNHGSGFINAAWSTPTKVIELASEEWWNPYFLKLCVAMDVKKYSVIKTQNNKISLEKLADELKDVQNR